MVNSIAIPLQRGATVGIHMDAFGSTGDAKSYDPDAALWSMVDVLMTRAQARKHVLVLKQGKCRYN